MRAKTLSRRTKTQAEIDIRIHDLVLGFLANSDITTAETLGYFRAAYVQGYTDCLKEAKEDRGKWIKELGYGVTGVEL